MTKYPGVTDQLPQINHVPRLNPMFTLNKSYQEKDAILKLFKILSRTRLYLLIITKTFINCYTSLFTNLTTVQKTELYS